MRTTHRSVPVTTRRTKPSLLSRLLSVRRAAPRTTTTTTTRRRHHHTAVAPVHHKRRPSIGDKIAGALMRLKGSLTRRSGVKVIHLLLLLRPYGYGYGNVADARNRVRGLDACAALMDAARTIILGGFKGYGSIASTFVRGAGRFVPSYYCCICTNK